MSNTLAIHDLISTGKAVCDNAEVSVAASWLRVPYGCIAAQQGDLYLWKLAALPEDCIEVAPYAQLAPGATLGSRHCLASLAGVRMFHRKRPGPLDGPVVLLAEPGTISHPVHGDIVGIPAGSVLRITYQQRYADTVQRAED